MDPWLEHPAIWPDVHNSLIAAIRDALTPRLAPKYYVGVEERTYVIAPADPEEEGLARPDLTIAEIPARTAPGAPSGLGVAVAEGVGTRILPVVLPQKEPITEWFLEVHLAGGRRRLVTVLELLSPSNKSNRTGRRAYLRKRERVLQSRTHRVEIDLLRKGRPMPLARPVNSPYRVLVSRGESRPRATLYTFGVRDPVPPVPIPLLPDDPEPELDLGPVLHALYDRARYDLRLDYGTSPVPPLSEADAAWAAEILTSAHR
jgi:hypothetical protein